MERISGRKKFEINALSYVRKVITDAYVSEGRQVPDLRNVELYLVFNERDKETILWVSGVGGKYYGNVRNKIEYRIANNFRRYFDGIEFDRINFYERVMPVKPEHMRKLAG
ncbi:hypothetical protein AV654_19450 [Paenibacillus elgii]|uniref:Uncharacterized protein n=1 Tax=Paenibacillus elgii TaxID=189691 RepID=A0A163XMZ8_9BACL|nr:hypothetical protein [Paenibacillus elgii]KZE78153.1 hypothetical protein AV654_19450 [Paenibacillus elgii]